MTKKKVLDVVKLPLIIEEEPLIYSIKYPVGKRIHSAQFFRNGRWRSFLKTFFRSFKSTIPVVLRVTFLVSPREGVKVSKQELRSEALPAVDAWEICDYTLSLMEMLPQVLIHNYRQIVKLDVQKFYSDHPRTVMQLMRWDEYVELYSHDTMYTSAKSFRAGFAWESVQSQRKRYGKAWNERLKADRLRAKKAAGRAAARRPALRIANSEEQQSEAASTATQDATHTET